jgi:hypothetical protein
MSSSRIVNKKIKIKIKIKNNTNKTKTKQKTYKNTKILFIFCFVYHVLFVVLVCFGHGFGIGVCIVFYVRSWFFFRLVLAYFSWCLPWWNQWESMGPIVFTGDVEHS